MSIETLPISDHTFPGRLSLLLANRIKRGGFLYWAALLTMSVAIIHFLAILLQRPPSGLLGALLFLGALIQAISAVSVVVWPARRLLIAAGVVDGLALLLWLLAHTTGVPVGFTDWRGTPSWVYTLGEGLGISRQGTALRADQIPANARKNYASPVSYVTPDAPPFLILQGADDWFITPHHSQKLASLLQAAHVPTTLVMIQHDEHGLASVTPGQVEQPSPDALIQMIQDFFVKTLAA